MCLLLRLFYDYKRAMFLSLEKHISFHRNSISPTRGSGISATIAAARPSEMRSHLILYGHSVRSPDVMFSVVLISEHKHTHRTAPMSPNEKGIFKPKFIHTIPPPTPGPALRPQLEQKMYCVMDFVMVVSTSPDNPNFRPPFWLRCGVLCY